MSDYSLPKLVYEDYFWYDIVNYGYIELGYPTCNDKNCKEFSYGDSLRKSEKNGKMFHVDKPFYEDVDDYYRLKLRIADSKFKEFSPLPRLSNSYSDYKIPLLFISLQDIDVETGDFESLRTFFLSEKWNQKNNFLKTYCAVLGECFDSNDNLTNEFWIICEHCYPQLIRDYIRHNELHSDEIKFMTYDLLEIAQSVEKLDLPCVIDKRTVMISRDPASPFPKLMLSPLAFVLGKLNEIDYEENEEPLPQIGNLIEKLGIIKENEEIIKELRENQSIENIMKLEQVKKLKYFVNGPCCSLHDCVDEKIFKRYEYGTIYKATYSNGSVFAIKKKSMDDYFQTTRNTIDKLKCEAVKMRLCNHNNIVKYIALAIDGTMKSSNENSFNTSNLQNVGIVMEYCEGGDLERFVQNYRIEHNGDNLPLDLIGNIFYQIVSAQHYLHFKKKFINLYVEPENFLIKYEPQLTIKFCGFDNSRTIPNDTFSCMISPVFNALNIILDKQHSDKYDLFSLGICLYYLTTSRLPFKHTTYKKEMKNKIPIKFPLKFQTKEYDSIINLVQKLTKYEKSERISWKDLYEHPYMKLIKPY
ncbi:Protein kinase domain containing protein [Entamoeba marina]